MNHDIVEYSGNKAVMTIRPAPAFTGLRGAMLEALNETSRKELRMIHGLLVYYFGKLPGTTQPLEVLDHASLLLCLLALAEEWKRR